MKRMSRTYYWFRMAFILALIISSLLNAGYTFVNLAALFIIIELIALNTKVSASYNPTTHPVIAIDIDDTVWDKEYFPDTGVPYRHSIETINRMHDAGYEIIMWTSRGDDLLEKTEKVLKEEYGLHPSIEFNTHANYFLRKYHTQSQKVAASIYIDDKAYGNMGSFKDEWDNIHLDFLGVKFSKYISMSEYEKNDNNN